jgi:hypothetical protein
VHEFSLKLAWPRPWGPSASDYQMDFNEAVDFCLTVIS